MCIERTRRAQSRAQRLSRAHVARTPCAGRALSIRWSRAQHAQVARISPRSLAQVATSFPYPAPGQVATSLPGRDLLDDQARSRRQSQVATSKKWGRDTNFHRAIRIRSRHQIDVATPNVQCPRCEAKNRSPSLRPAAVQPGRDFNS